MSKFQDNKSSVFAQLRKREKRTRSAEQGIQALLESLGGKDRGKLNQLWMQWEKVMGSYIASLSYPLGQEDGVLLVGADDAMAMQELSLLSLEILERANEHMGEDFFTKTTPRLMQGRPNLARRRSPPDLGTSRALYTPEPVGRHLGSFDPESPVTRCYEAHAKANQDQKDKK